MRILPILFNTPMVRLILGGRKTQTRRVVKPVHLQVLDSPFHCKYPEVPDAALLEKTCEPAYQPGDVLYVRETWGIWSPTLGTMPKIYYRADAKADAPEGIIWKPSIHMPKEAARIFLRVTDVGVERLQEPFFTSGCPILELQREGIDIGNQCRECIENYGLPCCIDDESECGILDDVRYEFSRLWDSTIKPPALGTFGWSANPWVWVYTFERCEKPEGF